MCYPHQREGTHCKPVELLIHLTQVGLTNNYRTTPEYNDKMVFVCGYKRARVDVFFVEALPSKEAAT